MYRLAQISVPDNNVLRLVNRLLGFIARSIESRSAEVILKFYLALTRSRLDYAVRFWSPYYRMDIILLVSAEKDDQNDRRDS